MTLPALATEAALEASLGETLTGADSTRAQAALGRASALIRAEARVDFLDPDDEAALDPDLSDIVVEVCLAAAERAYRNPTGARAQSLGSFSESYGGSPELGVYLTPTERRLVRQAAGITSVTAHALTSQYAVKHPATGFIPDDLVDGDDLAWVTLGDENAY